MSMLKRMSTTIEEIKDHPVPKSHRKHSEQLTCAVVNKSPLHPTKNGKMFSMNLCDDSSESMLRAVCFNENHFPKFKASRAYDMSSFKIKKAYGNASSVLLLNSFALLDVQHSKFVRSFVGRPRLPDIST
jgi:hypothetical protein